MDLTADPDGGSPPREADGQELPDDQLLDMAASSSPGERDRATAEIFRKYDPHVRGVFGNARLDRATIDDLSQETWEKVLKFLRKPDRRPVESLGGLIRATARNILRNYFKRTKPGIPLLPGLDPPDGNAPAEGELAWQLDDRRIAGAILADLSPQDRGILVDTALGRVRREPGADPADEKAVAAEREARSEEYQDRKGAIARGYATTRAYYLKRQWARGNVSCRRLDDIIAEEAGVAIPVSPERHARTALIAVAAGPDVTGKLERHARNCGTCGPFLEAKDEDKEKELRYGSGTLAFLAAAGTAAWQACKALAGRAGRQQEATAGHAAAVTASSAASPGGVTVPRRFPRPSLRTVAAHGRLAVGGIVLVGAVFFSGPLEHVAASYLASHGTGTTAGPAIIDSLPGSPSARATATEAQAAASLAGLLAQSASDRSAVTAAYNDVSSCGPRLSQDAATFRQAAASRQSLISQLQDLPGRSPLPGPMTSDLLAAWRASAISDSDYSAWAGDEAAAGCTPDGRGDSAYQSATSLNGTATAEKKTFAALWNPLAARYGLPGYDQSQI